jgi:hypothetical protein
MSSNILKHLVILIVKLAFIVPYRDRLQHLHLFLQHYKKRFPDASFWIIEQEKGKLFNRGKLLNVGFLLAQEADYFVFHDVDMLSVKADYSYPGKPTHLASKASQFKYQMPFKDYFGGVVLFTKEHFTLVNGFSNNFWDWGGEDNEMLDNVLSHGLTIDRREGVYTSLHHKRKYSLVNEDNMKQWKEGRKEGDGLSHCEYSIISRVDLGNVHKILVSI